MINKRAWIVDYDWDDGCRFGNDIALVFADSEEEAVDRLKKALWKYDGYLDIRQVVSCKEADNDTIVCDKLAEAIRKGK